ncbi:MAG: hypothetical protein J6U25_03355 [Clostridia bacterium]|nr:hypothetical protein [Clostridia bacterium]
MKRAKGIFALLLAVVMMASVVVLSGCFSEEIELEIEGKDECFELLYDFFEDTLDYGNLVVTYKNGNKVQFVEHIDGTTSNVIGADGTTIYAYINDDDEYCYAYESDDYHYYEADEYYYDMFYGFFLTEIKLFETIPEDSGVFTCVKSSRGSTTKLDFLFTADSGSLSITVTAKRGLVKSIKMADEDYAHPEENSKVTLSFEYDTACVTIPDVESWANIDNNRAAIYERDEFFFSTLYSNSVVVTVQNGESSYVETIADGVDYVAYTNGVKTYAFINDDFDYIYAMDTVDTKIYFVDEEYFEMGRDVYYRMNISVFDALVEEQRVTFTCVVNEDDDGNGTMTFTVKVDGEPAATITAVKEAGFVKSVNVATDTAARALTFAYGEAVVAVPDISNWSRQDT